MNNILGYKLEQLQKLTSRIHMRWYFLLLMLISLGIEIFQYTYNQACRNLGAKRQTLTTFLYFFFLRLN